MIEERDLIRHLEEGKDDVWNRPEPPALDLAAITGANPRPRRRGVQLPSLRLSPRLAGAGALACTVLGLALGAVVFGGDDAPPAPQRSPAVQLALEPAAEEFADARATVGLFFGDEGTTAEMSATGLPEPADGEFYEVWAVSPAGKAVSLGKLPVGGKDEAHGTMDVPARLRNFRKLLVSLEPDDGDPAPSGRSVLQSATS